MANTGVLEKNTESLFQATMQRLYEVSLHDDLLNTFRIKAWDRFLELGMPNRKGELFHRAFLELYKSDFALSFAKKMDKKEITPHLLSECLHSHIVFVNGHFSPTLSDISAFEDAELESLNQAMESYGIFLQSRLSKSIEQELDPFAILNAAIYSEAAFFYLPPYVKAKTPLQVIHYIDELDTFYSPRLQLFLSEDADLTITNTYLVKKSGMFLYNYQMEVSLDQKACLNISSLHESREGWIFEGLRAHLKMSSKLDLLSFSSASRLRQDYQVKLLEKNSEAKLKGVSFLSGNDFCKTDIKIHHQAEECLSDQHFKSVLKGNSQFLFNGKIQVDPVAQKTEAYQLNQNLLLSDEVFCRSNPNLEILADDVKASHGMTATELDTETLFYLTSRGLSKEIAKEMMVEGFCKEVLHKCRLSSVKEKMFKAVKS